MRNSAETDNNIKFLACIAFLIVAVLFLKQYRTEIRAHFANYTDTSETAVKEPDPIKDLFSKNEPYELVKRDHPCYAYETLSEEYKLLYDEIYSVFKNHDEEVLLSIKNADADVIGNITHNYVLSDNPELFYVQGYSLKYYDFGGESGKRYYFTGTYTMEEDEIASYKALVEDKSAEILSGLPADADAYAVAKYAFEYIINNTSYELDCPQNQNILSVLLYGKSVCAGYARTYQYLLQKCGMTVYYVRSNRHAWDLVKIGDDYYYVDATWGDPSFISEAGTGQKEGYINYSALLMTTEELRYREESAEEQISEDILAILPACNSQKDNYYVREELYFDEVDSYQLALRLLQCYEEDKLFTVRFSNDSAYDAFLQCLDDRKFLQHILQNGNKIKYQLVKDPNFRTATIIILRE